MRDRAPLFMVEAKTSETEVSPALRYFQDLLGVPAVQLGVELAVTAGVGPVRAPP